MGEPLLTGFLLDTHIWLWYVRKSDELPPTLRRAIQRSDSLWLSPVSLWELGLLVDRGRVRLDDRLRPWSEAALRAFPVREATVTNEVALVAGELALPHRDPADRLLAATALVFELTLLTVDRNLTAVPGLRTRSE